VGASRLRVKCYNNKHEPFLTKEMKKNEFSALALAVAPEGVGAVGFQNNSDICPNTVAPQ